MYIYVCTYCSVYSELPDHLHACSSTDPSAIVLAYRMHVVNGPL